MTKANRNEWLFKFDWKTVKTGSETKIKYHFERLEIWKTERSAVESEIGDVGFNLREHFMSGGSRHEMVLNVPTSTMNRFAECSSKILEHRKQIQEHERFIRALDLDGANVYELTIDDVEFFGL